MKPQPDDYQQTLGQDQVGIKGPWLVTSEYIE